MEGKNLKKMFIFKRERKTMVQFQGDIYPIKSLIAGEKQQHAANLYNVNEYITLTQNWLGLTGKK